MAKLKEEEDGDNLHDDLLLAAVTAAEEARQSNFQNQHRKQQQWLLEHHKQKQQQQREVVLHHRPATSTRRHSGSQTAPLAVGHLLSSSSVENYVKPLAARLPPASSPVCGAPPLLSPPNKLPAVKKESFVVSPKTPPVSVTYQHSVQSIHKQAPAPHEREQKVECAGRMAGFGNRNAPGGQNHRHAFIMGVREGPHEGSAGDLNRVEYRESREEAPWTERRPLQEIQPWVESHELELRRPSGPSVWLESEKTSCSAKERGWFPGRDGVAMFRECQDAAMRILLPSDYTLLHGRRYIKKTGWRKIAFFFNISFEIKDKNIQCDPQSNVMRAEFVIRASMPTGRFTDSQGSCDRNEKKFNKPNHDIPSTAETRAKTRACQDLLGVGDYKADESF